MTAIRTYTDFLRKKLELEQASTPLSNLGVNVNGFGIRFCWEESKDIVARVKEYSFLGDGTISLKDAVTLAIAENQEACNGHCDDYDIELVNTFFGLDITRAHISKISGIFI